MYVFPPSTEIMTIQRKVYICVCVYVYIYIRIYTYIKQFQTRTKLYVIHVVFKMTLVVHSHFR